VTASLRTVVQPLDLTRALAGLIHIAHAPGATSDACPRVPAPVATNFEAVVIPSLLQQCMDEGDQAAGAGSAGCAAGAGGSASTVGDSSAAGNGTDPGLLSWALSVPSPLVAQHEALRPWLSHSTVTPGEWVPFLQSMLEATAAHPRRLLVGWPRTLTSGGSDSDGDPKLVPGGSKSPHGPHLVLAMDHTLWLVTTVTRDWKRGQLDIEADYLCLRSAVIDSSLESVSHLRRTLPDVVINLCVVFLHKDYDLARSDIRAEVSCVTGLLG
jgi:hypothetical protein